MQKTFKILLIALAVCVCLSQAQDIRNFPKKPNVEIIFVRDLKEYLNSHPDVNLQSLEYNKNEGYVLGKKYEANLFDLEFKFKSFGDGSNSYSESYTHHENGILDIQYVKVLCKNNAQKGSVYLVEGGIGQSSVTLVVRPLEPKDTSVTWYVKVNGDIYNTVN